MGNAIISRVTDISQKSDLNHKHSAEDINSGIIPIERGGTASTTITEIRKNLDVYSKSEIDDKIPKSVTWKPILTIDEAEIPDSKIISNKSIYTKVGDAVIVTLSIQYSGSIVVENSAIFFGVPIPVHGYITQPLVITNTVESIFAGARLNDSSSIEIYCKDFSRYFTGDFGMEPRFICSYIYV